jgi:sugar/nucleoside kinase (ribokinase family)
VLIKLAGLQSAFVETMDFSGAFRANWEAVSEWSEVARYRTLVSANKAQCLYLACAGKPKEVLAWIEQYW